MDEDIALILAICTAGPLYIAILTKFIYDYSKYDYLKIETLGNLYINRVRLGKSG